ncbi:MAG: helix-turn-helix transcriptional regulator [Acidimicrobiales bacterium]
MAAHHRTGGEEYFERRLSDPTYRSAYSAARRHIGKVDALVQSLDARREEMGLTKAELARRADLAPEAVRRLFSVHSPNPTVTTLIALADALEVELSLQPRHALRAQARTRRRE